MNASKAVEAVLAANESFYKAFREADLAAMDGLWARSHPVACIHPGAQALSGREAVMESWTQILQSGNSPAIECQQPQAHLVGEVAFVTCYEALSGGFLVATNIFALEDGDWAIVHHQAGPTPVVPARPAPGPKAPTLH